MSDHKKPIIRADLYSDRKCIHVKIRKEVLAEFRSVMFKYGISMQDAYNAFTESVANNGVGVKIVESAIRKKLKEAINRELTHEKRQPIKKITDYDHDTIYSIISDSEGENEFERELDDIDKLGEK